MRRRAQAKRKGNFLFELRVLNTIAKTFENKNQNKATSKDNVRHRDVENLATLETTWFR